MNKIVLTAAALLVAASGSAFAANGTQHVKKANRQVVEQVDNTRTSSIGSSFTAPRVSPTDQDPFTMPDAGYGQGIWGQ